MTISSIAHRGYELRAYSHQEFLLHRDPYDKGSWQFLSVVRIDIIAPTAALCSAVRYNSHHRG